MIDIKVFDELLRTKVIHDSVALFESVGNTKLSKYDIFISYSSNDKKYAILTKNLLEKMNVTADKKYTVYIDLEDTALDPTAVSEDTAKRLESAIDKSAAIIYIHSEKSNISKWCPWELGIAQGKKKPIAILELYSDEKLLKKQAYLEMYPTLTYSPPVGGKEKVFWVHSRREKAKYVALNSYITGKQPYIHN